MCQSHKLYIEGGIGPIPIGVIGSPETSHADHGFMIISGAIRRITAIFGDSAKTGHLACFQNRNLGEATVVSEIVLQ